MKDVNLERNTALVFAEDQSSTRGWWDRGGGGVSDGCPLMWEAAISTVGRVSRGHIEEIRLAADHTGRALQSSTQIDETRRPLARNLHAISLPCAHSRVCI